MTVAQAIEAGQFDMHRIRGDRIGEAIAAQKEIFESCDGVFVNSNWVKCSIVSDYGISAERIHVIGAGASVDVQVDLENKEVFPNVLFVGRDWDRKGGPILLEAFRKVRKHIPQAMLTIIGCSPDLSEPGIEVLGYLDKRNPVHGRMIDEAYAEAAVLCVPSLFDPFGMCWLESQFCGVVPVTFSGEGRSEAMKDGVTGVLVEERNENALSDAILSLLTNPDKVRSMGRAGYEYARENFTWDCVAQKVMRVIRKDLRNGVN
jgi:glycosyltransferase involved in cell wall biosynthesis